MEQLDKEMQMIAVEKVLEEMQKAEEYVKSWNASWYEELLDAHCLALHYGIGEASVRDLEDKYGSKYRLANAFYSKESIGVPLAKETLVGNNTNTGKRNINFECEFGRIDWHAMKSHKSRRYFSFNNNGQIYFSKTVEKRITPQNPRKISYDATFNVLSNDFSMNITIYKLIPDWRKELMADYISIDLNENILTKKLNDIEIIEDLNTGIKLIKIVKEHNQQNNASIVFEATLDSNENLEMGAIAINTHKSNGKVNGTYRFDVSRKKGIRANFYSRKGIKVDLTTNSMLLENTNNLLLPTSNNQNSGDIIVSNFASSTQNAIAKSLNQRVISFDSSDFNMETVKQTETMIIEVLKTIKGELPLSGLVERIDKCLEFVDQQHNLKKDGSSKTLKLEAKNMT